MLHQPPPPQNTILRSLPADALAILQPHLTRVRVKRRVILQEAHAPAEKVHFIESGMAAVLVRTHQDGPVQVADCEYYRIIAAEYAPLAANNEARSARLPASSDLHHALGSTSYAGL